MSNEIKTKPNVMQAVPFFSVSDMDASLRYYVDGLGFSMVNNWIPEDKIEWCWLQLGGASLMLQEFRRKGEESYMSAEKTHEGISIYFICEDALQFYREVIARGIEAAQPFVGNNMWVTGLLDPDGYRLYFESYTDVEEETFFSE